VLVNADELGASMYAPQDASEIRAAMKHWSEGLAKLTGGFESLDSKYDAAAQHDLHAVRTLRSDTKLLQQLMASA
jgi:hypothetical protein